MTETNKKIVSDLQYCKGVGPVRAEALATEGIITPEDLMKYYPRDYIDRTGIISLKSIGVKLRAEAQINKNSSAKSFIRPAEVTVVVKIIDKTESTYGKSKKMLKFLLSDGSDIKAEIVFWSYTDYYNKAYELDEMITISGKAELNKFKRITFHHPEIEKFHPKDELLYREGGILPIYRMTEKLKSARWTMRQLRDLVTQVAETSNITIKENIPNYLLDKLNFPDKTTTVTQLHFPDSREMLNRAVNRMKFEEIFFFQLFMAVRRRGYKKTESGLEMNPKSTSARTLFESLPFNLTNDQKRVIREISHDMSSSEPMNRLLQGDVGSGKTIVAALSMLVAVDNGFQTLIIAPTEILAEQHYHSFKKMFNGLDVEIVQLVGGQKVKVRRKILESIESGKANIIIGTHALFESTVHYKLLGLIVIDEQHRFGVAQRAKLKKLAELSYPVERLTPDILLMSATPIPRTLSLSVYGDLDVSIIKQMPAGRKPIKTKVVFESELPEVFEFIRSEVKEGRQAFIVYPLVEKSDKLELKSAVEHFETIDNDIFHDLKCGLIHGQMFWYEKEEVMQGFLEKEYDVLVATTVIEVGIDIPNASVMLIENSERFGLSQLHQLRGRVGRSDQQSYCLLATKDNYKYQFSKKSKNDDERINAVIRLKTMEESTDGFRIAEVDMELRGPGDVLGTKQSGLPSFRFLDIIRDVDIISSAKKLAEEIIDEDPHLRKETNKLLKEEYLKKYAKESNYFDTA